MPRRVDSVTQDAVFLNIPYDQRFRALYLAYIAGLVHLGLEPRVTLGLPSGIRRLDRIAALIQVAAIRFTTLSRVGLDRNPPFLRRDSTCPLSWVSCGVGEIQPGETHLVCL